MKSVIGMIRCEEAVCPAVDRLKGAGIPEEQINILSSPDSISKLLGCDPACVIRNYITWGVVVGIAVYSVFGLAAAFCECNLMQFGQPYGIGAFIGAILAGTLVGVVIGALVGAGEAEKETHLYLQGVRLGGKVISIQVPDEDAARIERLLDMDNITGVKAFP